MAMHDDVCERQALGLIKAFRGIADPRKRQRILDLAEQLANDPGSDTAKPGVHEASTAKDGGVE
ncbi:hypothetical protein XH98_27990 [Bradyrhizobium sp. CCBAU 51745]|uniref:hypothetical protein n=1 Tax=Bradyrhizobium sp. CCBAU 51745 TaxID=1325099 RepID=UPI0023068655|nr:hypothetical protein [Bradyrhizobium sp. CCBAU 51745]MDA9442866.1 hypothetical protein [Bradyrhizobium sp. CCBAU 51745]